MTEVTKEPTLNKKFELVTDDFIEFPIGGKKPYRIRALIDAIKYIGLRAYRVSVRMLP